MLKDEILAIQGRLEDKKTSIESMNQEYQSREKALQAAKVELQTNHDSFKTEIAKALAEKKEKVRTQKFLKLVFIIFTG